MNAIFLILLLAAAPARASVSDACRAALGDATRGAYDVEVLTRGAEIVVLFGESHVKSKHDAERGRRVLPYFQVGAAEGRHANRTWGGRLRRAFFGESKQIQFAKLRRAEAAKPNGLTEGSTASEADRLGWRRTFWESKRSAPAPIVRAHLLRFELNAHEGEILLEYDGLVILTRSEAMRMLRNRLNGIEDDEEPPRMRVVPLETDHRPRVSENIESLGVLTEEAKLLEFSLGALALFILPTDVWILASSALLPAFYTDLGYELFDRSNTYRTRWFRSLFPLHGAVIHGRDDTMAEGLVRLSAEVREPVLAIVGRLHVPGLRERLIARGYRRVPL